MQKFIAITILLASLAVGWFWMDYQNFLKTPLKLSQESQLLQVKKGVNLKKLARELVEKGWLDNANYLYWHARLEKKAHLIRAGEYAIQKNTTPTMLLGQLIAGKTVSYQLTLLEGWNFNQVLAAVNNNKVLVHQLEGVKAEAVMERLGFGDIHPEGRFFPETYAFPRGTTDIEFLQRAYRKMQSELAASWEKRDKESNLIKTPYEALTLASIIEKETGLIGERRQISGVFTRRLSKGMKLQTDPTVIYGMGKRYQGNIRRKDLREDTPYNTYVHKGLPPTPICMPGRAAIDAALHPLSGKSLYFVASGNGGHVFSNTLKAHNAAVRKYILKK